MTAALPDLVRIPPGEFWMGENMDDKFANDTERPRHLVRFESGFFLGRTPVTVGEYRCFQPDHAPGEPHDWPVVNINWLEAKAFCRWLSSKTGRSFRLPSESEWEYAARAASENPYPWGNTIWPDNANYLYTEQGVKIGAGHRTPVNMFPPNAFGAFDLHGNVCEWTEDLWHPDYQGAPSDGSTWQTGGRSAQRVLRGGAWDYLPRLLRSSWRDALPETTKRDNVGFRVAADLWT
ncbi:MAG TPA: formylglycine-generating enzyme family protein [Chthoniobacterales bacterium]